MEETVIIKINMDDFKSELIIGESLITVRQKKDMPCLWWRFWYWALLGWTWRKVE